MHVLSISPHFSINGVTLHADDLNDRFVGDGHLVTSIPLSIAEPIVEQRSGDRRRVFTFSPPCEKDWYEQKMRLVDAAIKTFLGACDEPVDLIHSHDWLAGRAGTLLAAELGCPHLMTIHTLTELQRQEVGLPGRLPVHAGQIRLEKELCAGPATIVTVSQAMRRKIETVMPSAASRIVVVPNGVPTQPAIRPSAADCSALRRRLAPAGESIVLFVGRLAPQKGLDFLLSSSLQVRASRPKTLWFVAGDHVASHMMRPVYNRILEEDGASAHVSFLGEIPHEEVEAYYRAADCLVVPSLFEGCPYVVLEAMRAGLPIIATDLPCFREILTDRETALLVPCDENAETRGPRADLLAKAQLELLENPALGRALATRAARVVRERFALDTQLERTFKIYRRIAGAGTSRQARPA